MKSLTISKYNVGLEPIQNLDQIKFRHFVDNNFQFGWKENLNPLYAQIQKDRKDGLKLDNIKPREKMDFYCNYNERFKSYDFSGTYHENLDFIHISFQQSLTSDSLTLVFSLANFLDSNVYDGDKIIHLANLKEEAVQIIKNEVEIKNKLIDLQKNLQQLFNIYPSNYSLNTKTFIKKMLFTFDLKILPWDYSIESAKNLKNITIHHIIEGIPKDNTPLQKYFGNDYTHIFEYYIGEIIKNQDNNFDWDYSIENNEGTLCMLNHNSNLIIFPGEILLKLLASEGNIDIVEEIVSHLN